MKPLREGYSQIKAVPQGEKADSILLLEYLLGGTESNPMDPLDDEDKFFCGQCKIPLSLEPLGFTRHCSKCSQLLCSICVRPQSCPT